MTIDKVAVNRIEELEAELAEAHAELNALETIIEDLEYQVASLTDMQAKHMPLLLCNLMGR